MSEDAATEWLAVAANEVLGMPRYSFEAGCREARQTCTHHGQILPTILKSQPAPDYGMADKYTKDWNKALDDYSKGYPALEYHGGPKRLGDVVRQLGHE